MSVYQNYTHDFPYRCRKLLEKAKTHEFFKDHDVTFMLMVASAGLTVPYERLRSDSQFEHPAGDRDIYPNASIVLDDLLKQPFLHSILWADEARSWCYGGLQSAKNDPDSWPELQTPQFIRNTTTVKDVLLIIRIGLAHGNIFTKSGFNNEIMALIFVSGGYDQKNNRYIPLKYISVAPNDFYDFLVKWFNFLDTISIPDFILHNEFDAV